MTNRERLPVAVSEQQLHAIESVDSFRSERTFLVAVTNHGRDAHVHLALDDTLSAVATLAETNVYVERSATREVEVTVEPGAGLTEGELTVETGYGAESATIAVSVGSDDQTVPVDDDLGRPSEDPDEADSEADQSLEGWVPLAALALVALAIAGGTAALVSSPVVIAGVVAVLVGVVVAAVLVWR